MKFLNLIISLFARLRRSRRRKTASAGPSAVPTRSDAVSFFRSGIQKFNSTQYHAAIGDFSQAIALRSNFHQAFYNRGLSRLKIDDNQEASFDFSRAIEIHPAYAKAYMNRGIAKNRLGDPEGAQEDFAKSVEIDPKLYPLFTVRKIKVKKTISEDAMSDEQTGIHQRNEGKKTGSSEETEDTKVLKTENKSDEEGFMGPMVLESEKDEFSPLTPVQEEDSEYSEAKGEPEEGKEDETAEYKFEELISEDESSEKSSEEQSNEDEEKRNSIEDDFAAEEDIINELTGSEDEIEEPQEFSVITDSTEDDDSSDAYEQMNNEIEAVDAFSFDKKEDVEKQEDLPHAVNEAKDIPTEKLPGKEDKFLAEEDRKSSGHIPVQDVTSRAKEKTNINAENISRQEKQERGAGKYHLSEPEDSIEELKMPFQAGEETFEDHELSEYIAAEEEELTEKEVRGEAEVPDGETPEERSSRAADDLDPALIEHGGTIELPEQEEIKRILAESLPDSRINYARGFFYRAKLKYESGDKTGAVQDYSNAIEFFPKFSQAYLQRGITQAELDELAEAVSDYSKAIENNPKNPLAYYYRALANQKAGKNREALADFTKAIIFDPRNPQLYILRGMLRYEMGQARSAFSDWGRAEILGSVQARQLLQKYVPETRNKRK